MRGKDCREIKKKKIKKEKLKKKKKKKKKKFMNIDLDNLTVDDLIDRYKNELEDNNSHVINHIISRIAILAQDDDNTDLKKLVKLLCTYCTPNPLIVEGLIQIMSIMPNPAILLDLIPRISKNTNAEIDLILEAYENILKDNRTYLLPILGSLSSMELPSYAKNRVYNLASKYLMLAAEEDVPIVISIILKTMDEDKSLEAIKLIRKVTKLFKAENLVLVMQIFDNLSISTKDNNILCTAVDIKVLAQFLKFIQQTINKMTMFDLLSIILLINHTKYQELARKTFLYAFKTGILSINLLLTLCQNNWPSLLQKYTENIFTLSKMLISPISMLDYPFKMRSSKESKFIFDATECLNNHNIYDWALLFIPNIFINYPICRMKLIHTLLRISSKYNKTNISDDNFVPNCSPVLSYRVNIASICILYLSINHVNIFTLGRLLLEEILDSASNFHPIVSNRLTLALCKIYQQQSQYQQQLFVPIQKNLTAPNLKYQLSGLRLATHVLSNCSLSDSDFNIIFQWVLRLIDNDESHNNDASKLNFISLVYDSLSIICSKCPKHIINSTLKDYLLTKVSSSFNLIQHHNSINNLKALKAQDTKQMRRKSKLSIDEIPKSYIFDPFQKYAMNTNGFLISAFSNKLMTNILTLKNNKNIKKNSLTKQIRFFNAFWSCFVKYSLYNTVTKHNQSDTSNNLNDDFNSFLFGNRYDCNCLLQFPIEIAFESKRLYQWLFPSNASHSVIVEPHCEKYGIDNVINSNFRSLTFDTLCKIYRSLIIAYCSIYGILHNSAMLFNQELEINFGVKLFELLKIHRMILLNSYMISLLHEEDTFYKIILPYIHPGILFHGLLSSKVSLIEYISIEYINEVKWKQNIVPIIDNIHHILRLIAPALTFDKNEQELFEYTEMDVLFLRGVYGDNSNVSISKYVCRLEPFSRLLRALHNPNVFAGIITKIINIQILIDKFRPLFPNHSLPTSDSSSSDFIISGRLHHTWNLLLDILHFLLFLVKASLSHARIMLNIDKQSNMNESSYNHIYYKLLENISPLLDGNNIDNHNNSAQCIQIAYSFFSNQGKNTKCFPIAMDYLNILAIITQGKTKSKSLASLAYSLLNTLYVYPKIHKLDENYNSNLTFLSNFLTDDDEIFNLDQIPASSILNMEPPEYFTKSSDINRLNQIKKHISSICKRKCMNKETNSNYVSVKQVQLLWWWILLYTSNDKLMKYLKNLSSQLLQYCNKVNEDTDFNSSLVSLNIKTASIYFEILLSTSLLYISKISITKDSPFIIIYEIIDIIQSILKSFVICCKSKTMLPYFIKKRNNNLDDLVKTTLSKCLIWIFPILEYQINFAINIYFDHINLIQDISLTPKSISNNCYNLIKIIDDIILYYRVKNENIRFIPRVVSEYENFKTFIKHIDTTYSTKNVIKKRKKDNDIEKVIDMQNISNKKIRKQSKKKKNGKKNDIIVHTLIARKKKNK